MYNSIMNNNLLPENETVTFEDQIYLNPQTALDESNTFIDNLRAVQQANNQAVNTDLENLGTYPAAQSNLGGLLGGSGYFANRYQVPQTVALTNDLRVAAQASALNQALQNEQAKWKQRYNKAYRDYQRRAGSGGSGGGGGDDTIGSTRLPVDVNSGGTETLPYSPSSNLGVGRFNQDSKGTYYLADGGKKYYVGDFTAIDDVIGPGGFSVKINRQNGDIVKMGGKDYLYYSDPQTQGGGSYFPIISTEGE